MITTPLLKSTKQEIQIFPSIMIKLNINQIGVMIYKSPQSMYNGSHRSDREGTA